MSWLRRFFRGHPVPCHLSSSGWSCGHEDCDEYEDAKYWEELKASLEGGT